jgi:hypothetical protein
MFTLPGLPIPDRVPTDFRDDGMVVFILDGSNSHFKTLVLQIMVEAGDRQTNFGRFNQLNPSKIGSQSP